MPRMSEYKSGDIAAFFSKLKMPRTESGMKLKNLFKEFYCQNEKGPGSQSNKRLKKGKVSNNKGVKMQRDFELKQDETVQRSVKKSQKWKLLDVYSGVSKLKTENKLHKKAELSDFELSDADKAPVEKSPSLGCKQRFRQYVNKLKQNEKLNESSNSNILQSGQNTKAKSAVRKDALKFKRNSKIISKDSEANKSNKLIQSNSPMVRNSNKLKIKKLKEQCLPSISKNEYESENNSNTRKGEVKFSMGEGSEDFVRSSSFDDAHEKKRNTVDTTIFVGNLPINVSKKDLKNLFGQFGQVENVHIAGIVPANRKVPLQVAAQKHKYHDFLKSLKGYVQFEDRQSSLDALVLNGTMFRGHHIFVDLATHEKKLYDDKKSIFLGNLPFDVEDEAVWEAFSQCGSIDCVRVVRHRETGTSKGFGYVVFNNPEEKEKAIKLERVEIGGRTVRIKSIQSKVGKKKDPVKSFDTFKSKALKIKKRQENNSSSKKSVSKIKKQLKQSQKKKRVASFILNDKKFNKK